MNPCCTKNHATFDVTHFLKGVSGGSLSSTQLAARQGYGSGLGSCNFGSPTVEFLAANLGGPLVSARNSCDLRTKLMTHGANSWVLIWGNWLTTILDICMSPQSLGTQQFAGSLYHKSE